MPLFTREFDCPSCGGTIIQKNPDSRSVCCPYCGQTSHLHAHSVEAAGDGHFLIDYGSVFEIGQRGVLNGNRYEVLGRMRLKYPDGFWDEWYTYFPDKDRFGWIQEDDGSFLLFLDGTPPEPPLEYAALKVGAYWQMNRQMNHVFITSKSQAEVEGGEGELPFAIVPGDPADFVEGVQDGVVVSVELIDEGQFLYLGKPFTLQQVER